MQLTFKLVIVWIENSQIFLSHTSCTLILIHSHNTLQELYHLVLGLVPHCSACVDTRYVVRRLNRGFVGRRGAIRVHGDSLIVLVALFLLDLRQILRMEEC